MKTMKKVWVLVAIVAIAATGLAFMPGPKKITLKGSDTMVILAQKWAEV